MTQPANAPRPFSVHARNLGHAHARVLRETSFEAAVVAYLEEFHPPLTDAEEITVLVREIETGHEHCFRIDLESGESTSCN